MKVYLLVPQLSRGHDRRGRSILQRRRVEPGQELLRGTDLLVTDVADELGFAGLSSFSHAFRQLNGDAPSRYAQPIARQLRDPAGLSGRAIGELPPAAPCRLRRELEGGCLELCTP